MQRGFIAFIVLIAAVMALAIASNASFGTTCGNGHAEGRFPASGFEECDDGNTENGDGCSSSCRVEFNERIYVAPYMGNIDGHFTEDWFFFYEQLADYFDSEGIPVGATLYPATLDNPEFHSYIKRIYESPNMEIVQKAWTGLGDEQRMDELSFQEQMEFIARGREAFRSGMADILGIPRSEVDVPMAYNQPQGRFTNTTREVLESLGFRIFFEMYMNDDLGPVEPTERLDVLQYGVGLTTTGGAGPDTDFFQPGDSLIEIRDLYREDLYMLEIDGSKVIPVWVHHQDFESKEEDNTVDEYKWSQYRYLMQRIKDEPNLILVSPSDIWEFRHPEGN